MNIETIPRTLPGRTAALADRLAAIPLADLSEDEIAALSDQYDAALVGPRTEENDVLLLLTRPFSSRLDIPEYYRYTGLHVFDWFLSQQDDVFGGCVLAMHATLTELSRLEQNWEITEHTPPPSYVTERLHRLDRVLDQVGQLAVAPDRSLRGVDVVAGARGKEPLEQQLLVLKRCCGFRRSTYHNEHIFIRAVQACELAFFMIRWVARQAITAAGADHSAFVFRMRQLVDCADLLNAIFHVLRTLSPEMFLDFRDATGDASAVQSLNYHLMELVVYGYDERKKETYTRFPHLDRIDDPRLREFRSLRDTAETHPDPDVFDAFSALEQGLLVWRGRHYGFGRTYLPNMKGSGGTEGAGYLKRFVDKSGFHSGSRVDDPEDLLSPFAFC